MEFSPSYDLVEELRWRGLLHDAIPGTQELLNREQVTGYVGFDPTADSLHIGNLVPIMLLTHLQRAGHRPIALVGGATGMIGDPSGKSAERNLLDEATLRHNHACIRAQLERILDFGSGPNGALMTNNYDWFGPFTLLGFMREVGKHMLERQSGSIVNICSIMGSGANESNVIAYAAAKGGLRNVTQQLGCEWAERGVRVNSVSPGFIVTEMVRPVLETLGMDKWIASRTPMRRIGELHEVVAPVMFLASDAASYITGHDLLVDGGTNAANGYYQIPPIHHEWNKDTAPKVGAGYPGVQPRPDWYQVMEMGIPGLHYPLPEA